MLHPGAVSLPAAHKRLNREHTAVYIGCNSYGRFLHTEQALQHLYKANRPLADRLISVGWCSWQAGMAGMGSAANDQPS